MNSFLICDELEEHDELTLILVRVSLNQTGSDILNERMNYAADDMGGMNSSPAI